MPQTTAPANRSTEALDAASNLVTAFPSWDALVARCKAGYVPTLRISRADSKADRLAKVALRRGLDAKGLAWWMDRPGGARCQAAV